MQPSTLFSNSRKNKITKKIRKINFPIEKLSIIIINTNNNNDVIKFSEYPWIQYIDISNIVDCRNAWYHLIKYLITIILFESASIVVQQKTGKDSI